MPWCKYGSSFAKNNGLTTFSMLLRLRQLTGHVLMLQFVMRDLLEMEDIERIREAVCNHATDSGSAGGRTILAIRKQLDRLSAYEKKKGAEAANREARRKAAEAKGEDFDGDDQVPKSQPEEDDAFDTFEVLEADAEIDESPQHKDGRNSSGGGFGKDYNFKPFLNSLKTGNSWEKVKEKARCSYCGKQPKHPYVTSCGHLICGDSCLNDIYMKSAEEGEQNAPCKSCGTIPQYIHPCDPDEDNTPESVAQGTRNAVAKKEQQRKRRDREDIAEDWLGSLGEDVLPSAKTVAVKAQILNWIKENSKVKIIVYTQFLAM